MDYLKFLLTTIIAFVILGLDIYSSGIGTGTFAIIGGIIGYLIIYRPIVHAISFTLWMISLSWWSAVTQTIVHMHDADDPQRYTADHKALMVGILFVAGMIVFHPINYGLGRLAVYLWNKSLKFRHAKQSGSEI